MGMVVLRGFCIHSVYILIMMLAVPYHSSRTSAAVQVLLMIMISMPDL